MSTPIFSLTRKDFRWCYFSGSGNGGQNRNKHENCVRLFHDPSGAQAVAQDQRDRPANERMALRRLSETKEFKRWTRMEASRLAGQEPIEDLVERESKKVKVEVHDDRGRWVDAPEKLDDTESKS